MPFPGPARHEWVGPECLTTQACPRQFALATIRVWDGDEVSVVTTEAADTADCKYADRLNTFAAFTSKMR